MKSLKCTFCAMGILMLNLSVLAQTEYAKTIDNITQYLDKSPISTGILYDRTPHYALLTFFNQFGRVDTTNTEHLLQAYYEMQQSSYNKSGFTNTSVYRNSIESMNLQNKIPIMVADYNYQTLALNSIDNGLLNYSNGYLNYVSGVTPAIYTNNRIQLVAPMTINCSGLSFTFSLRPWMILSNNNAAISYISLSFSDGSSTVNIYQNQDVAVTFNQYGSITADITVHYNNGDSFSNLSAFTIATISNNSLSALKSGLGKTNLNKSSIISPMGMYEDNFPPCKAPEQVVADLSWQGESETRAKKARGDLYYYYSNCNDQTVRKPVLVIDGLDPEDTRKGPEIYGKWFSYLDQNGNPISLGLELRQQGFDFIILDLPHYVEYDAPVSDWVNGTAPVVFGGGDFIERNAMLLVKVIQKLNAEMAAAGSTEQITIVGPSMGGQISRYALTYMEEHGIPHNCRLWVSFDSPHLGANVPLGLQNNLNDLAGAVGEAIKTKKEINLDCPAARQQLIHHYSASSLTPQADPLFYPYYNRQNTQGIIDPRNNNQKGWPVNCRRIAMVSGADDGTLQYNNLTGGDLALEHRVVSNEYTESLIGWIIGTGIGSTLGPVGGIIGGLIGGIFGGNLIEIDIANIKMNVYPNYGSQNNITKFWMSGKGPELITEVYNNLQVANGSLDLLPGGKRDFFTEYKNSAELSYLQHLFFKTTFDLRMPGSAFIPIGSSLAYGKGPTPNSNRTWSDNVTNIDLTCLGEIPFDAYYAPTGVNLKHDSLFYQQAMYLKDEIMGIPIPGNVHYKYNIIGNPVVCNSSTYYIDNLPSNTNVTWSIPGSAGAVLQLTPNSPVTNQLTIDNHRWYPISTTLSAVFPGCNESPVTITKPIANDNDNSPFTTYSYNQEECMFYNVNHPSQSGTITSNSSPVFVHQGCTVTVNLSLGMGKTVNFIPADSDPVSNPITWFYSGSTLYFQLPLGSGGIPFRFKITGQAGTCYEKTLLFFTYSNNARYAILASPNPSTDLLNVTIQENVETVPVSNSIANTTTNNFESSIKLNATGKWQVSLIDINGKQIKTINSVKIGQRFTIQMNGLASGIYIIKATNGKENIIQKIIVGK